MVVVAFFSNISQLSFVLSLSDVYPSKHDCLLPYSWWMVGPLTSTLLSRGGTSPRTTSPIRLHPRPLNLYASGSIVLEISGILRHDLRPNTYIWALHPFNNNNNNRFRIWHSSSYLNALKTIDTKSIKFKYL